MPGIEIARHLDWSHFMLRLTKRADHAVVILCLLARRSAGRLLNSRQVAEATQIPRASVSKLLRRLVLLGWVESFRGARAGYRLVRHPGELSLAEIVFALEPTEQSSECHCRSGFAHCPCAVAAQRVHEVIRGVLTDISLAEMADLDAQDARGGA